jgi:hypothetical protein
MIFPELFDAGPTEAERHYEKNKACHFKPKLMQHASKSARRTANGAHNSIKRAAAARLIACDPCRDARLAPCRNFAHGLDFNSLRRYNDATSGGEPFRCQRHRITVGWLLSGGGSVDPQLKQLMKELGDAINESLSDSEQISEVVSRIKEGGYDIFLVLEATIGVSKQGEKTPDKTSLVTTLSTNPEFKVSDQDLKFLKSLRIKIDEDKHDKEK